MATKKTEKKTEKPRCVARDSFYYGSRECAGRASETSDLCERHQKQLMPAQLIGGVLYFGEGGGP